MKLKIIIFKWKITIQVNKGHSNIFLENARQNELHNKPSNFNKKMPQTKLPIKRKVKLNKNH